MATVPLTEATLSQLLQAGEMQILAGVTICHPVSCIFTSSWCHGVSNKKNTKSRGSKGTKTLLIDMGYFCSGYSAGVSDFDLAGMVARTTLLGAKGWWSQYRETG